jgi:hypothetical protein
MKKFLIVLGVIFLVVVILGGAGIAFLVFRGIALDKESRTYADAAIPTIVSKWSEKELLDRASPEFKKAVTIDQLDRMFRWFSRLGQLESCEPAAGQAGVSVTPKDGKVTGGQYTSKAKFQNGEATVSLRLIKHGDQWQILRFDVSSPALAPQ